MNNKGKFGYADEKGALVIDYQYDFFGPFAENGIALVKKGKNFGLINRSGELVLPVAYSQIAPFDDERLVIMQKGKLGLAGKDGTLLHKPEYLHILPFNSQGIAIAVVTRNSSKADLLDEYNTVALLRSDGLELVRGSAGALAQLTGEDKATLISKIRGDTLDTGSGYFYNNSTAVYYNLNGEVVLDDAIRTQIYKEAFGPAFSLANRHPNLLNFEGNPFENILIFKYNYYVDNNTAQIGAGYFDLAKQKMISRVFYTASRQYDSKSNSYKFFIDGITVELGNFAEGKALVHIYGKKANKPGDYVINTDGKTLKKFKTHACQTPKNGYMIAKGDNFKYGLIEMKRFVWSVLPQYWGGKTMVSPYGNWAASNVLDKWGVISSIGDTIVPFEYNNIVQYNNGNLFGVHNGDKWGVYYGNKQILDCVCDSLYGVTPNSVIFSDWREYWRVRDENVMGIYWLSNDSISRYAGYEGLYGASKEYHNGYIWLMRREDAKGNFQYGCVNNFGQEVVPFVLELPDYAKQAVLYFKDRPVQKFTQADAHRLNLFFSRKTRSYSLYMDIPLFDWDY